MKLAGIMVTAILLTTTLAAPQERPAGRAYERVNWSALWGVKERMKSKADENDMEQIQARLSLASACQLPKDDLDIAVTRAQKPSFNFGIRNMDGLRWLMSAQVVAEYDKCQRMKADEDQIQQLQTQIKDIKEVIERLQQALAPK